MNILIILNDPPYGTERSYHGLRLAKSLVGNDNQVTVFLMADAVSCACRFRGENTVNRMAREVTAHRHC
jgi:sulfur relay (sulfurtransferase) complex TusBCD TusD component (DsrE family)